MKRVKRLERGEEKKGKKGVRCMCMLQVYVRVGGEEEWGVN